jgi:hypothetical protein
MSLSGGPSSNLALWGPPVASVALVEVGLAMLAPNLVADNILASAGLSVLTPLLIALLAGQSVGMLMLLAEIVSLPAAVLFALAMFAIRAATRRSLALHPGRAIAAAVSLLLALLVVVGLCIGVGQMQIG